MFTIISTKKALNHLTLFIGLIILFCPISSYSQNKITGNITNDKNSIIDFKTVMLYKTGDSIVLTSTLTDEKGVFEFLNIASGNYFFKINEEGHIPFISKEFKYDGGEFNFGELKLMVKTTEIEEISVVARKPVLTVTGEKTILNVANITNMAGLNGLEVLRRTPGVMIDKDNNITLKGKSDVKIFMDGRPSQLANDDLVNLLKSMNAADIESIEVIKNPSAKYDASGTGGVINIVLKKNKGFGNNFGIEIGTIYSKTGKYNSSLSFNHRDKRFNVFSNYSISGGEWQNYMQLYRIQAGYLYDQQILMNSTGTNQNFKFGSDYFLSKKHTFGVNVTGNTNIGTWGSSTISPISQVSTEIIDQVLIASNESTHTTLNSNINGNYRFADTLGTKFSTDIDFGKFTKKQNTFQPNAYYNSDQTIVVQENNYGNYAPTTIQIITLKSDFEKKIKKNNIGLGYKISNVETDNTFDFFNIINAVSTKDESRSNTFHYSETVYAGYVNYNRNFKKFGIQTGLRYEHTHSIGTLKSTVSNPIPVDRKYGNFFPSAALTFNMNSKNAFTLTYSRRIDRPNYQDLNPFENKLNELSYQKGNAFLKPQYSNSIELSHVFMEFLTSSVGYTRTYDFMTQIVDTLNSTASFLTQTNIDFVNTMSFNLSAPIPIKKWWFGFLNFNLSKNAYHANFSDGKTINLSIVSYNVYLSNSFTLKNGYSIELSGWYNSPTIDMATFFGRRIYSIDAGFKKKILKGKGDLKLNFSDILHTQIWSGSSNYAASYSFATGGYESRQIRLNFSYRFGNNNVKSENHKTGSEDEKNRIKAK